MALFKDRRDNSIQDLSAGPTVFGGYHDYVKSAAGQADLKASGKGFLARKVGAPLMARIADKANKHQPITVQKKGGYEEDPFKF